MFTKQKRNLHIHKSVKKNTVDFHIKIHVKTQIYYILFPKINKNGKV